MQEFQTLAQYTKLQFKGDDNYYTIIGDKGHKTIHGITDLFNTVSDELFHAKNVYKSNAGYSVDFMIGGEYWTNKYWFKESLQPLEPRNWYLGTSYPRVIRNKEVFFHGMMLFYFSQHFRSLTIHYFKESRINNVEERLAFCRYIIPHLKAVSEQ